MIEKTILDYLKQELDPVPVGAEVPEGKPPFVVFEKTGSSETNKIKSATIAVQSYEADLYKTIQLNEIVKGIMLDIVTLDEIAGCRLESDYNFTDTRTKMYRYQAVFTVTHY